ncbi:hypothetical protein FOA52_007626 [Chlamydomonas sp. UWO 241]|nr:hypothetical protein FOA52_007626 [Chlamydomonas sp. UWO 241]
MTPAFYRARLAPVASDGVLRIRSFLAIALVYPLLLLGAWILVLRDEPSALKGAVFGAVAYGVYNLTNMATLPGYSWALVAVDTLWGAAVFAAVTAIWARLV